MCVSSGSHARSAAHKVWPVGRSERREQEVGERREVGPGLVMGVVPSYGDYRPGSSPVG